MILSRVLGGVAVASLIAVAVVGWLYAGSLKNNGELAQSNAQLKQDVKDLNDEIKSQRNNAVAKERALVRTRLEKQKIAKEAQDVEHKYAALLRADAALSDWDATRHPDSLTNFLQHREDVNENEDSDGEATSIVDDRGSDAAVRGANERRSSEIHSSAPEVGEGM